jgi:hypothetical protein
MRKIDYTLDIGFPGCQEEGTMDVPNNMSTAEIDEMVAEMANEYSQSWVGDTRLGFDPDATDEEQEDEEAHFMENVCGSWVWHIPDEE